MQKVAGKYERVLIESFCDLMAHDSVMFLN